MATVARAGTLAKTASDQVHRFDVHQIIQHAGMMVSFILLVITGLPLKYHDASVSQWWAGVWGGIDALRGVHHFAAWTIIAVCVYHLIYIFVSTAILKRPFPLKMVPAPADFIKFFQEIGYYVGARKDEPQWDRFNWKEKFDYWAIFWGMPVMGLSGLIMMYPVLATKYLPGWVVPTALVAHSDEAMLALTWIFMVHIFFNHFSPRTFPMNTAIFTGKVALERYKKEHTLEYEAVTAKPKEADIEIS